MKFSTPASRPNETSAASVTTRVTSQVSGADLRPEPTPSVSLFIFSALGFINLFRIGYQLLVSSWFAVQTTREASSVGYVLLAASLTTIILAPFAGKIIDTIPQKRWLLICGNVGIAMAGAIPLVESLLPFQMSELQVLILTTCLITAAGFFASGPLDYYVKTYISPSTRMGKLATLNMVTQIAFIVGTATAGAVIAFVPPHAAFLCISLCGVMSGLVCLTLLPNLTSLNPEPSPLERKASRSGPLMYLNHLELFSVACCAALVFSVGQVTNTLLPALVNLTMKRTSVSYSLAETAWSLGAFILSALMARRIRQSVGRTTSDLLLIAAMAAILLTVPFLPSFQSLVIAHFVLGLGFAFVRLRSESRFLMLCPTQLLGQFRANSQLLTSLIGLAIFGAPVVFGSLPTSTLYILLSSAVSLSALLIFAMERTRGASIEIP
jgi:MFS family permease